MTTITCQYTGIEFEGRGKNHPKVSKFLDEASKEIKTRPTAYAEAKRLLSEARGNFKDIDSLMIAVKAAYADWRAGTPSKHVLTYKERRDIGNAQMRAFDRSRNDDYEEQTDGNAYSPAPRR